MAVPCIFIVVQTIFLTLSFVRLCLAVNVVLRQPGQCDTEAPSVRCPDLPADSCCQASFPWCGAMICEGCNAGIFLYAYHNNTCTGASDAWCVHNSNLKEKNSTCCLDLGGGEFCGGVWRKGWATTTAIPTPTSVTTVVTAEPTGVMAVVTNVPTDVGWQEQKNKRCFGSIEPTIMSFVDAGGRHRDIYVPKGQMDRASELFMARDFEGLVNQFMAWPLPEHDSKAEDL
ncbi:hypothetical protein B0H63DRAFT_464894 [Podospora didyma]|uniref:Uncharacterized protein n=1 Tax=Podospora didyma TaxID=330526 RepID=A0AAE0NZD2_9PEZI|nr:hypothetical protein B0H63DRAFT_464894 [Podospora didyma]